ncbi:MAG: cyclic nucleotide-binding domain-containing protein [Veillonellaceae bacterium]|nr:cyclic nucleotide-binding domain-containing protein [Veillonellaceae bacterium]
MEKIQIGIASTEYEKEAIFRLRYHIYVEEMYRQPVVIDHGSKMLFDELDKWAFLLYAKIGSEIIGTMRVNIGLIEQFPRGLAKLLYMDNFKTFCQESGCPLVAFSSKLMVSPAYRNSPALHLLSAKGYELYCNHHVQFNFGGCNFYLLRLYEQFGCRRFGRNFIDPGYGMLTPFVLMVNDASHLKAVRSPFIRIARKRGIDDRTATEWFYQEFPEAASGINSQLVTEEELWDFLCQKLGGLPQEIIPALRGLTEVEARSFLYSTSVSVHCYPGDHLITAGLISDELNILMSGRLISFDQSCRSTSLVHPGQHFGKIGLFGQAIQNVNIKADTDSDILVVSRQAFTSFSRSKPGIAYKIKRNLLSGSTEANFRRIIK